MKAEYSFIRSRDNAYSRLGPAALLIFFFVLLSPVSAQTPISEESTGSYESISDSHNRALANLYCNYAAQAFRRGEQELADKYARSALLFDPDIPDARYIRAINFASNKNYDKAGEYLSRSLLYSEWTHFDPFEARRTLTELFYRKRRTEDAYHLFSPYMTNLDTASISKSAAEAIADKTKARKAEDISLYVRILLQLGQRKRAVDVVRNGHNAFPENAELEGLRVELDPSYRDTVEERILAGDRQQRYKIGTYKNLIASSYDSYNTAEARSVESGGAKSGSGANTESRAITRFNNLISAYEERWGTDRFIRTYRLWSEWKSSSDPSAPGTSEPSDSETNDPSDSGTRLEAQMRKLLEEHTVFTGREIDVLKRIKGKSLLARTFPAFSGEVRYDLNSDGYVDKRVYHSAGTIERMEFDHDQDTRPEVTVFMSPEKGESRESGSAVSSEGGDAVSSDNESESLSGSSNSGVKRALFRVNSEADNRESELWYGTYPNLIRSVQQFENSRMEMKLVPYELDFSLFQNSDWSALDPPRLKEELSAPRPHELLPYVSEINRRKGTSVQRYEASIGASTLQPDISEGRTVFGLFDDATLETRRRDTDGDGRAEIVEKYRNGELYLLSYDENQNGRAEYIELHEDGEVIRLWDTDEDGEFDSRMREREDIEE